MTQHDLTGQCMCGAIQFRAKPARDFTTYCHCVECRRFTGHHWAAVRVMEADLHIENDETLSWYSASGAAKRGFCAQCGSSLFFSLHHTEFLGVAAGALDRPTGLTGRNHIFIKEKGDYYEIGDGLPQHDAW